jgi:hypothetical protein
MARFYRVYSSIIVNIRSVLPSCVIHALPVGLGLYSARFNFAILRARLALASLILVFGTCLLYQAYRLFPLVDPIKRFLV